VRVAAPTDNDGLRQLGLLVEKSTQEEVATALRVSRPLVSQLLSRHKEVTPRIRRLAFLTFGIPVSSWEVPRDMSAAQPAAYPPAPTPAGMLPTLARPGLAKVPLRSLETGRIDFGAPDAALQMTKRHLTDLEDMLDAERSAVDHEGKSTANPALVAKMIDQQRRAIVEFARLNDEMGGVDERRFMRSQKWVRFQEVIRKAVVECPSCAERIAEGLERFDRE